MKKKNMLLLPLILIMSCLLCACGGGEAKATIVDNDGNEVLLSAKEVEELYDTNQVSFEKNMQVQKSLFFKELNCLFKILVGFVGESCYNIGRKLHIRESPP